MMDEFLPESHIANLPYLESLFSTMRGKLSPSWEHFFDEIEKSELSPDISKNEMKTLDKQSLVKSIIETYKRFGHLIAATNPIAISPTTLPSQLNMKNFGLSENQLHDLFPSCGLSENSFIPLEDILESLKNTYCNSIGFEYKGLVCSDVEQWIDEYIDSKRFEEPLSVHEKKHILETLIKAEALETFLHTKHVGKKRFSLEGEESLIPLLNFIIATGCDNLVEEAVIGMSHRGRINVLANVLGKSLKAIFQDFDDAYDPVFHEGMGDIRYHKGHVSDTVITYHGKRVKLTLVPNPSHLESVNAVVEGIVHAKQFLKGDEEKRSKILPILMHGDGAFAGQGVVYETLQMSQLKGFEVGGTLHIVINNQIGFTTSPKEGRSTYYCTDIAKAFGIPVFHVNAEDPNMCIKVARLALEIRNRFHLDVIIDLCGWRRWGHNEGDEPSFTQPIEVKKIKDKKSIASLYAEREVAMGFLGMPFVEQVIASTKEILQKAFSHIEVLKESAEEIFQPSRDIFKERQIITGVCESLLTQVALAFERFPQDFHVHPKLKNLYHQRALSVTESGEVDFGTAELLCYGTLVLEGHPVRLAGQDSGRGTFSHRQALLIDQENGNSYSPLSHISTDQARFIVLNTLLSEAASLGFEYGYSTVCTMGLNIWEAQFGDFANSAQVMIDQYIASGEEKWGQKSNLVLLLPHGFEGQGPEHSSARLERFLSLCSRNNMQVANPTTPAQLFHLLRREVKGNLMKPLIVMTPKGLLRNPLCVSPIRDLQEGKFYPFISDSSEWKGIDCVVLCSGRIYYDLAHEKARLQKSNVAIIRVEQLYPLDVESLRDILKEACHCKKYFWVQEEPQNMGAWPSLAPQLQKWIPSNASMGYVGRNESATPATGFFARHKRELQSILDRVFEP